MSTMYDKLDKLGSLDDEIARLEHAAATLPAAQALRRLAERTADLDRQRHEIEQNRRPLADQLATLEEEFAHVDDRRRVVEARLAGATGAGKDLLAMDNEAHHLKDRLSQLEDDELALMEQLEPLDAALSALSDALGPIEVERSQEQSNLADQEKAVTVELVERRQERADLVATIAPELIDRYDRAARGSRGSGAARLVDGRCTGCHLQLPSAEIDRLRHLPMEDIATCEQCGRLLLRSIQLAS